MALKRSDYAGWLLGEKAVARALDMRVRIMRARMRRRGIRLPNVRLSREVGFPKTLLWWLRGALEGPVR